MQKERNAWTVREREMSMRADAGDTARRSYVLSDARVRELEAKLRLCLDERNRLQERVQVLESVACEPSQNLPLCQMIPSKHAYEAEG